MEEIVRTESEIARNERDRLLLQTDWTQVADAPVDVQAWATYRQQLRDLPTDPAWPDVDFPDPPETI